MLRGPLAAALALIAGAGLCAARQPAERLAAPKPTPSANAAPAGPILVDPGSSGMVFDPAGCLAAPAPVRGRGGLYGSAEYLLWWVKGANVPPLVTTGPAAFPVGFLGAPGTVVLVGGSAVDPGTFSGSRFVVGGWLGCEQRVGVEGAFFFLGRQGDDARFASPAFAVLTRPFLNANTGRPSSEFAAFPGFASGDVAVANTTRLWGLSPRARANLVCGCTGTIDLLGGLQYLDLEESLTVTERATFSPDTPAPALAGNRFVGTDSFFTRNQFYGGAVGADATFRRGPWAVNVLGQLGLGMTHQVVDIRGQQVVTTPAGQTRTVTGGLLALPGANIGRFSRDTFSVVPSVNVNLGYQISRRVSAFVGYSFLYWSSVVRPGEQIDPNLDVTRIPNFFTAVPPPPVAGAPRPAVPFSQTDFWAHGVNVGVSVGW